MKAHGKPETSGSGLIHVIVLRQPELTDDFFARADEYVGDKLVRRGRPKAGNPKVPLTVRYDADVVEAFKATGKGWQTRMNAALKEWLETHPPASDERRI